MLSKEGIYHCEVIKDKLIKVWGDNVKVIKTERMKVPFDEFTVTLLLYGRYEVLLTYDRSIIGLNIKMKTGYINIRELTGGEYIRGFESSKPDNLEHNFRLLDKVIREMEK